jgi:hypothetical protein
MVDQKRDQLALHLTLSRRRIARSTARCQTEPSTATSLCPLRYVRAVADRR